MHQDTVDEIDNLANATVADRETVAILASTIVCLTVEFSAVTKKHANDLPTTPLSPDIVTLPTPEEERE